jgi:hypothetical protein
MPVTLAQARLNVQDDLQIGVIDEFAKSSFLINNMTFDDCISPTGGGATLTYGYTRLVTQPTAAFRAVNNEYLPQEVNKLPFTTDLKVFGGSFQVDRVINNMGGIINEVTLQMQQKIKAAAALFNDAVINGDAGIDPNAFDGLDKAVTGSTTEIIPVAPILLDSSANVTANWQAFLDVLDEFLMSLDGTPSFIGGNAQLIARIRAVARRAGMYMVTKNDMGQQIEQYGNIPLVDFGTQPGSNVPVVGTNPATGETSIYVARLGLDGFHGVSMAGVAPVQSWLPDFKTAGAVKTGEVEMVAAVVLKATRAAGILRRIKVQ